MRKFLSLALVAVMFLGLAVLPANAEGEVAIEVFQLKVEINEAITNFTKRYSENTPGVTVSVETLGGGADYGG
ncbi:MAG: carbohydrate ABC transporter substrate-binding protein, partial [Clostridiales bacterium]|nr:carbohydrate ABC transporter substrate-binding protein [Clostridiales bacterium]